MEFKAIVQALERTEKELKEERANTLSLAGKKLERLVQQLHTLRTEIEALPEDARARHVEMYRELHQQARYQMWCLVVQREAVGLNQHKELEHYYPIPPPWRGT